MLDRIFDRGFSSNKVLGVSIEEGEKFTTIFRVFAPRARRVYLKRFKDRYMSQPLGEILGWKDSQGVWEMRLDGEHWGTFYGFIVEGPQGKGEGFDPKRIWPDPYAKAGIFHNGPSILIDPRDPGPGFSGWTDETFKIPEKSDLIIWEASVRDLTSHPECGVVEQWRGKFLGLVDSIGKGVGIDHMVELGINAVEFLPIFEFDDDPPGSYHWGYMPSLFFAPDAWYGSSPFGAQIGECKAMINALHEKGIAVILDVVYNHTGSPHVFMGMDKKYYYRHDGNMSLLNFSGCGNDFRTEAPMARKMILDSLEYWVKEYHVDGFRFDLAELIDLETLYAIEKRLTAIKPGIILIAEPWSFRGTNKGLLKNTSWSSWNDDFRNRIKDAALGRATAADLFPVLKGSVEMWTASPWESVNYVECHDNYTLTDHLCQNHQKDGSNPTSLDIQRNKFCAALTLLAPGIPMLAQGQEMLRSKKGNHNSYNAGDEVNWVDYRLKSKYPDVFEFYKRLVWLRKSEHCEAIRKATRETCLGASVFGSTSPFAGGVLFKTPGEGHRQVVILFNADQERKQIINCRLPQGRWIRFVGDGKVFNDSDNKKDVSLSKHETEIKFELPPISVEYWVRK